MKPINTSSFPSKPFFIKYYQYIFISKILNLVGLFIIMHHWLNYYCILFIAAAYKSRCNNILEDREVVCSSDRMVVNLSFRQPFNGMVFVQGQFQHEKCRWRGNGGHYLLVILPLRGNNAPFCGIRYDPILFEHTVMLVVSSDANILTQQSLALAVSCAHSQKEQQQMLTLTIGSPSIDSSFRTMERESVASLLGKAPPIPALSLLIKDGHGLAGPMLTEAAIGQRLTLDVLLSDASIYDMFVHDCIAHDGTKSPEATVTIIDENGCSIRLPRVVDSGTMVTSADGEGQQLNVPQMARPHPKHVYTHFFGFQFTAGPIVHFECQITLCVAPCGIKQCDENTAIRGSPSARISARVAKAQMHMRPQILQPIAITPSTRMERLVGENPSVTRVKSLFGMTLNCTDLAWLLLLATMTVLIFIAIWTIVNKLCTIIVGVYKAIKA